MDAFSIALGLGTMKFNKIKKISIALLVGIMHYIMPTLGLFISDSLSSIFKLNFNIFIIIIFIYSGFLMILDKNSGDRIIEYNFINIFLLAFSVSVDSFSVGLGLKAYNIVFFIPAIVFFACSFVITYLGLLIGEYSTKHLKEKAPILGGLIFFVLAFVNIIKYFT